jgi:SanA protein
VNQRDADADVSRGRPERPTWMRRLARTALLLVAAGALATAGANLLVRRLARPFLHDALTEIDAPVAIVPGASVHRAGSPSPQLEDRLSAALALIRAGRVQLILVSGARHGAYDEAGPMRRWLIQRGVRPAHVVDDHAGFRTLDTMARALEIYGIRRAVVCTQSFHLPRAVFLARRAGIDAEGLAVDGFSAHVSANDATREWLASLIAVIDTYLLQRQPRERGTPTPIVLPDHAG